MLDDVALISADIHTRLLHRLRTGAYCRLHPETRTTIANFAAVQYLRTPEHRIGRRQMGEQLIKFLRKHPGTESLIAELQATSTDDALRESHVAALLDLPTIVEFTRILSSHIWVFSHRHPQHSFYTSDAPIAKHGHAIRPGRGNSGIGSKGVEIHVPLSHDYVLTLYERTHFIDHEDRDGSVLEFTDPQHMVYDRQWQVMGSSRFIYCRDDDFDLAREICAEEPHWRDSDRKRFTSNHDDEPPS